MTKGDGWRLLLVIVLSVLALYFTRCFFNAVYYSDLPGWVKYVLLS